MAHTRGLAHVLSSYAFLLLFYFSPYFLEGGLNKQLVSKPQLPFLGLHPKFPVSLRFCSLTLLVLLLCSVFFFSSRSEAVWFSFVPLAEVQGGDGSPSAMGL